MIAGTDKELKLLDKASNEFAKKELAPIREENDKYPFGPFFMPALKKAYEIEFFHATLPGISWWHRTDDDRALPDFV